MGAAEAGGGAMRTRDKIRGLKRVRKLLAWADIGIQRPPEEREVGSAPHRQGHREAGVSVTSRETHERFLVSLEALSHKMRETGVTTQVHTFASILAGMVRDHRTETAETKRNLPPVKLPGEDAYNVEIDR